jgi:hypothetical protein
MNQNKTKLSKSETNWNKVKQKWNKNETKNVTKWNKVKQNNAWVVYSIRFTQLRALGGFSYNATLVRGDRTNFTTC